MGKKLANHYHVLVGLPGYLPNSNYPCETLKEAGDVAYEEAQHFREVGYCLQPAEYSLGKVVGNKRDGYEVLRPTRWPETEDSGWPPLRKSRQWNVWQTITISPCDMTDCRCSQCGALFYEEDCVCQECGIDRDDS